MQKKVAGKQRRTTQVKPRFAPSKIVGPTDFSDHSQAAVAQAAGLASQYDTPLILVHVVEPILYLVDYLVIPKEMEEGNLVLMDNARKRLEQLRTTLVQQGIRAEVELRMGKPYLEIADVAKKKKAGLVVLATHGHTGLKHFYLGSTAEKLIRHAPCSVLVVR